MCSVAVTGRGVLQVISGRIDMSRAMDGEGLRGLCDRGERGSRSI